MQDGGLGDFRQTGGQDESLPPSRTTLALDSVPTMDPSTLGPGPLVPREGRLSRAYLPGCPGMMQKRSLPPPSSRGSPTTSFPCAPPPHMHTLHWKIISGERQNSPHPCKLKAFASPEGQSSSCFWLQKSGDPHRKARLLPGPPCLSEATVPPFQMAEETHHAPSRNISASELWLGWGGRAGPEKVPGFRHVEPAPPPPGPRARFPHQSSLACGEPGVGVARSCPHLQSFLGTVPFPPPCGSWQPPTWDRLRLPGAGGAPRPAAWAAAAKLQAFPAAAALTPAASLPLEPPRESSWEERRPPPALHPGRDSELGAPSPPKGASRFRLFMWEEEGETRPAVFNCNSIEMHIKRIFAPAPPAFWQPPCRPVQPPPLASTRAGGHAGCG